MKTIKNIAACQIRKGKFTLNSPLVFSIPRPYEDAIVPRNKEMYTREMDLKAQYEKMKLQLANYAQQFAIRSKQTRAAIEISKAQIQKFEEKKLNEFHGLFE